MTHARFLRHLQLMQPGFVVLSAISILATSICSPVLSRLPNAVFNTTHQSLSQFEGLDEIAVQHKKTDNSPQACDLLVTLAFEHSNADNLLLSNARSHLGLAGRLSTSLLYTQTVSGYL